MPLDSSGKPFEKAPAYENKLRHFTDLDDLFDHVSSEQILEWVNTYVEKLNDRRAYHRKYQAKKAFFQKVAKKMLDDDELARIEELAREAAAVKLLDEPNEEKGDNDDESKV